MKPLAPPKRASRGHRLWRYLVGVMLVLPADGLAADVRVVGVTPGRSADIVIDGGASITIEVGETVRGITLRRADRTGAVLVIEGVTQTLPLTTDRTLAGPDSETSTIKLKADGRGHFVTTGRVNGRPLRFLVDTGASLTVIMRADAERLGVRYRDEPVGAAMTAGGPVLGWHVSLDSLRIGGVTVRNAEAFVIDSDESSIGLLGMSFLNRFDMQRQGGTLVLRRRR